jgi:hypothetical protein
MRLHLAASALALGIASVSFSATPESVARNAANDATNRALASFRTSEKVARAALDLDLGELEATLAPPVDPLALGAQLATILGTFQGSLSAGLDAALDLGATEHADAMTAFSAATNGAPFPRDVLAGGGGAADRLRDGLRALAAKSLAKARKRLLRTQTAIRVAAEMRTLIRLEPPRGTHEQGPNNSGTIPFGDTPLTIDVLIAFSPEDSIAGGYIVAGGQCDPILGDVALELEGSDGDSQTVSPNASLRRWSAMFGDIAIDLVDTGNEVLVVRQGSGAAATAAIGVP